MIALFLLLIISQVTLGDKKTKAILSLVDIPVSFTISVANPHLRDLSSSPSAASLSATSTSSSALHLRHFL